MKYLEPEMEVVKFNVEDVIRTSGEIGNIDGGSPTVPDINYNPQ